ncbi:hypothetical protein [Novipirellula aureliae]|nr:hypothetical protein [Novipirellula aureliae]
MDDPPPRLLLDALHRCVACCSGALLKMFICGAPVIVPGHCWLAEQVRQANRRGVVGCIYQTFDSIPAILERLVQHDDTNPIHSLQHAKVIGRRHHLSNTLLQRGLPSLAEPSQSIFLSRIIS